VKPRPHDWIWVVVIGQLLLQQCGVHADAGGFDRALAERLVRAVEAQTRAAERCR
jgi:hypothetical protein